MSDILDRKARFRLKRVPHNWTLDKSYYAKKEGVEKWRVDSYHPRLGVALAYLLDRLMAEGYETRGVAALLERLALAEARVRELGDKIEAGVKDAEIEAL